MKKRVTSMLLAFVLVFLFMVTTGGPRAEAYSTSGGSVGDSANYKLINVDGKNYIRVYGSGTTYDRDPSYPVLPFDEIEVLVVDGVSSISRNFINFSHVKHFVLCGSVTTLKSNAFPNARIDNLYIANVQSLYNFAFSTGGNASESNRYVKNAYYSGDTSDFPWLKSFNETNDGLAYANHYLNAGIFGDCGSNGGMFWWLKNDGSLTITGAGEMNNSWTGQSETTVPPWIGFSSSFIESILFDGPIMTIGQNAFYGCANVRSITLPASLTDIMNGAFRQSGLQSVTLPSKVRSIRADAFSDCQSLRSVTLPSIMDWIGQYAFAGTALTSVNIPDNVTELGAQALAGCPNLKTVHLPNGLKEIKIGQFYGDTGLTSVNIPESVTTISRLAFANCSALSSLTVPAGVTSIAADAFSGCGNLTLTVDRGSYALQFAQDYNIPYQLSSAAPGASYTVQYNANGGSGAPASQTKTEGTALTLSSVRPTYAGSTTGSYTVTLDPNGGGVSPSSLTAARTTSRTFKNWNTRSDGSGTSYSPGESYTANADVTLYAQWNTSTAADSVMLPTPTRAGYTFRGWATSSSASSGVTGSYTPTGNVTLYALWQSASPSGTWGDLSWTLDRDGLLTISGSGAIDRFEYNDVSNAWHGYKDHVKKLVIKPGVTGIGGWAFYYFDNLTSVDIPYGVTAIDYSAFCGCSSLESITLPSGIDYLGLWAFGKCTSLRSFTVPSGVRTIEQSAFSGCSALTSITLPRSIKTIGSSVFENCNQLADVYYEGTLSEWNAVSISESNNSALLNARLHCAPTEALTLPASLTQIEAEAFAGGAFTEVYLPERVTAIGARAFADCPDLCVIFIPEAAVSIASDAFANVSGLSIHGVDGSYAEFYASKYGFAFVPDYQ